MKYVLNQADFIRALIVGAHELSLIEQPKVSSEQVQVEVVANGVVLDIPDAPVRTRRERPASSTAASTPTATPSTEFASALREKMAVVMKRPPGVNTIKTWSPEQCSKVEAWLADPDGVAQPPFVVERKARGASESPPDDANGSASAPEDDLFGDLDDGTGATP